MPNFRIIYDNKADRATLTTSSTAGTLVASNLLTEIKSQVWRSTSTTASITATWAAGYLVGGVWLPFTNLTSAATIRVRVYTEVADVSPAFDSGTVFACPALALGLWGWGSTPLGVNAYSYGGGTYGGVWLSTPTTGKKVVIDLVDSSNTSGYVEAGRLVVGSYWEGSKGADYGASLSAVDTSKQLRNDAGDLMTDRGTVHRHEAIPLTTLSPTERTTLWNMLVGNGMFRPVFFSLYPENADTGLEQSHMLYGKMTDSPAVSVPAFREYATTINLEEM